MAYQDRVFSFHVVVKNIFSTSGIVPGNFPWFFFLLSSALLGRQQRSSRRKMCGGVFFFLFNSIFKIPFLNIRKPPPTFWGPLWGSCSLYIDRHGEVYKTHMVASFRLIARSFCCDLDFLWDSSSFSALLRLCLRGNGFPSAFSRSS